VNVTVVPTRCGVGRLALKVNPLMRGVTSIVTLWVAEATFVASVGLNFTYNGLPTPTLSTVPAGGV